jgi:copper(I)-binding protein
MKAVLRKRIFIGSATGLLLLAGALSAQTGDVTVKDPWVRVPGAGQKNAAAFMTIENHGKTGHKVVSVATDVAEKAELHEMQTDPSTKMMSMSPVHDIAVPAGGAAELKPGGYHVMMFNLKSPLKPGEIVNLTLKLDDGSTLAVAATTRAMDNGGDMMKKKM